MNSLKEQRLFSVVIRYHPEAEDQLREGFKRIILTTPNDQVGRAAQQLSSQVVNYFVQKHMIGASDQSIYGVLKFNSAVLQSLQNRPADCVGFALATSVDPASLPLDVIKKGSDLKADIVESAVNNPSVPSRASKIEDVLNPLVVEFKKQKYSIDDLTNIQLVSTLPPSDGCRIATSFSNALASMDEHQAAYVFKNLLLFGADQ